MNARSRASASSASSGITDRQSLRQRLSNSSKRSRDDDDDEQEEEDDVDTSLEKG